MPENIFATLEKVESERKEAAFYLSQHDTRIKVWYDHHKRISDADAVYRGDYLIVQPDDTTVTERPKSPNVVQLALDDRAALASSVIPSIRCDPANERGKSRAELRERIAQFYRITNRIELLLPRWFSDLALCGVNYRLVLPDFESGFPCIKRIDPRHAYPDRVWAPDRGLKNMLVSYEEPRSALMAEYPELGDAMWGDNDLVKVIEYYDSSEFVRAADLGQKGKRHGVVLDRMTNKIGKVPIVVTARPTPDGQFRGVFDQVLGTQVAENRIFNLMVDGAADWIHSQPAEFDIENPEAWGTGEVLHSRSPQGFMRRMPPDGANGQAFAILAQMQGSARIGAVYPEARQGQIEQNIASAAFVTAITGNLSTAVAQDQRLEAFAQGEMLALCFEVDEKYLNKQKFIAGTRNAQQFAERYTPRDDIRGDYQVRVAYAGAAGTDEFGYQVRLFQQVGAGLISERTAREQLPTVRAVLKEERQIMLEQVKKASLAFIGQQAALGNAAPAAQLIEALESDEEQEIIEFLKKLPGMAVTPPSGPASSAPSTGTEAFEQASSIARGGLPAPQQNVPQLGNLPGLSELVV